MPTIQSTLNEATDLLQQTSDSPSLDAEILLCFVLKKDRPYLKAWPEKELAKEQTDAFQSLIDKRQGGQPVAYLTGVREFWSREFKVTPDVLVPRPDTELLVELVLDLIPEYKSLNLIDLGTGSGAIAITLAAERSRINVTATDIKSDTLDVAKLNATQHNIKNIRFYLSNWFDDLPASTYDFVVSNPPYIAEDDPHLQQGDVRFEPDSALIAQEQGLKDITIIADSAHRYLKSGGYLLLEHGYNQQQQVQSILKRYGYSGIRTEQDYSGQPRVTVCQW